jgi:hypothetical protein
VENIKMLFWRKKKSFQLWTRVEEERSSEVVEAALPGSYFMLAGNEARFSEVLNNLNQVNDDESGRTNERIAFWKKKKAYKLWGKGKKPSKEVEATLPDGGRWSEL